MYCNTLFLYHKGRQFSTAPRRLPPPPTRKLAAAKPAEEFNSSEKHSRKAVRARYHMDFIKNPEELPFVEPELITVPDPEMPPLVVEFKTKAQRRHKDYLIAKLEKQRAILYEQIKDEASEAMRNDIFADPTWKHKDSSEMKENNPEQPSPSQSAEDSAPPSQAEPVDPADRKLIAPDRLVDNAKQHDLDARYKYLLVYNIPRSANRATIELKFQVARKNVRFVDDCTAIVRCNTTEAADRALIEQEISNAIEYRVKEAPMSLIEQMYDEQMRTVYVRYLEHEKRSDPVPMHFLKRFMLANFGSGYYKVMDKRSFFTFDTHESLQLFKNALKGRQYIKFRVMESGSSEDLLCCAFESMPPAIRYTVEFIPVNNPPMSPERAIYNVRTALHKKAIDPTNDILKE